MCRMVQKLVMTMNTCHQMLTDWMSQRYSKNVLMVLDSIPHPLWPTPPVHRNSFHAHAHGQLSTITESTKELMSMIKDMGQRLRDLESKVAALQSQSESVPSSSSGVERVPSQLTVSV